VIGSRGAMGSQTKVSCGAAAPLVGIRSRFSSYKVALSSRAAEIISCRLKYHIIPVLILVLVYIPPSPTFSNYPSLPLLPHHE